MSLYYLIGSIIIVILTTAFALQNAYPVTVKFLAWQFQGSLVVVIVGAAAAGFLTGIFGAALAARRKKPGPGN